jgi:predicted phosphodiesterase
MYLAALYDIHGNLPALDAVLDKVRDAGVSRIVVGGDVVPGPFPDATLDRLLGLDVPVQFIHGNGELAVLAQQGDPEPADVSYWGTTSGAPLPPPLQDVLRWNARQLDPEKMRELTRWPKTLRITVPGIGAVLFCHGTPRSETETFTRDTPEQLLAPVFEDAGAAVVVCGHTHMPFDRHVGSIRVINAGSVGMPFGRTGADWLLLGPTIEFRHTDYDLERAAARIRETTYPQADEFASKYVLASPQEGAMLQAFTRASF